MKIMKIIIHLLFFGVVFLSCESNSTDSKILKCTKVEGLFDVVGNLTYCKIITPIKVTSQKHSVTIIETVSSAGVAFEDQELSFLPKLPKNLTSRFRIFIVKNSSLKQITSNNLKDYATLEVLDLSENSLVYLEKDLLMHNHKLKYFDINSNRIVAIHSSVFESLHNLSYFNILYNKCASLNRFPNQQAIIHGMSNLKKICMNDCFLQLSRANKTIENEKTNNRELLKEVNLLRSKMTTMETITIITLGCVIAALILYIIHKNCKNSSNQRFHSKVSHKVDMFEETSSICFSSTAGGLDDYPSRGIASNFNTINRNQLTLVEDGLPKNTTSEYADPILFTKHDIQQRQQNSSNYANSEVNPSQKSSNYQNCGQFSDGSDVRYQNYPLGQSTDNLKNLGKNLTLNIQDVDKRKPQVSHESAQYMNLLKGAASAESIGQANSPQNVHKKSSESVISSQNTMTHSINDLSPTKQPESLPNSSNYDSSTQRSVKTAEIGKKTVKYTNISRAPSQTEGTVQSQPKVDQNVIQTPPINPQIPRVQEYSSQFSTSSTGSIRRPKNIPNLQKPKFFDNINQKLQVITPRDNKPFEFPILKSPGFGASGQKDSLRSSQKKKPSKGSFRSAGVHQSPTESTVTSPKSPGYEKPFSFEKNGQQLPDLPGSIQNLPNIPDFAQNYSNTGTFSPKTSTAFSLNLSGNQNQLLSDQKSPSKSPNSENAPKLPNRNNLTLTKKRESVDVDYCEPLSNTNGELYSEPYSPNKIVKK